MLLVLKNIFYIMEESAMPKPGLPRRYLIFLGGVIFTALGVALITLAGMGTSAVSSLSYVLTFVFPGISFGTFTFIVNASMVVGQILVLRREFKPLQLLQLPATFLFSVSLDLWMYLLGALTPQSYPGRWVFLLLGCICPEDEAPRFARLMLEQTTTLGVRCCVQERYVLSTRTQETRPTRFGPVRFKRSEGYGVRREKPESDDVARIAREANLSFPDAAHAVEQGGES